MTQETPLTGNILISCAKANAKSGMTVAARQCGYGDRLADFQQALQSACAEAGIEIHELSDLLTDRQRHQRAGGVEIAPDSYNQL